MKAVMYHYVQPANADFPKLRHLDTKSFEKQLDWLEVNFQIATRSDWEGFCAGRKPNSKKVILTFDDGLRSHYDFVLPILEKRGLWGFFFVSTGPLENNEMLLVHKIHCLCANFRGIDLLDCSQNVIGDVTALPGCFEKFSNTTYNQNNDEHNIIEFKRLLNYYLSGSDAKKLINEIAKALGYRFPTEHFYMTIEEAKSLERAGNIVGSHTHNHHVMNNLTKKEQSYEITHSLEFLNRAGLAGARTYCHPYGGINSYNKYTEQLLRKAEVSLAFDVDPRRIEKSDLDHKFFLPRYDCNLLPFGKC